MKTCKKCKELKPTDEFNDDATQQSGKHRICKKCYNLRAADYRARNIEKRRAWNRKSRRKCFRKQEYGLTPEAFQSLLDEQDNKCAVCRKKFKGRVLGKNDDRNIDHDHETDEVRGVLCSSCNNGIGMLGDNYEGVLLALRYLEQN